MSSPLRKSLSLGGPAPLRFADIDGNGAPILGQVHYNDYRLLAKNNYEDPFNTQPPQPVNANYVKASSKWAKLWLSWRDLQPARPTTQAQSWQQLNTAGGAPVSDLRRLDRQIRALNNDGIGVILTIYQSYPDWSRVPVAVPSAHSADQQIPDDLSPAGPWAFFLNHLICRYKAGVAVNSAGPQDLSPGPQAAATFGNPAGAVINAIEIVNEPNLVLFPQSGLVAKIATMMQTADNSAVSYGWGSTGQFILAPGTSDVYDKGSASTDNTNRSNWEDFTIGLILELNNRLFAPGVVFGWSHHNYYDVKYPVTSSSSVRARYPSATSRAQIVQQKLPVRRWAGGDNRLWLTEGGFEKSTVSNIDFNEQYTKLNASFNLMVNTAGIYMFTQHSILDEQSGPFLSGLGYCNFTVNANFNGSTTVQYQDESEPNDPGVWTLWKTKPGSSTL